MRFRTSLSAAAVFAVFITFGLAVGCGDSDDGGGGAGSGGSAGTGGGAGSGGSAGTGGGAGNGGISVVVPGCLTSGYQVVFRAFLEPMDPLLRYMDTPADQRDARQKPPIVSLSEL